jgi:hypothetical protein
MCILFAQEWKVVDKLHFLGEIFGITRGKTGSSCWT